MAFESLSDKLQNIFKNLRGKGRLTEADVKTALKEVKLALLEADVSFKVVKQFIKAVQERAIGQDVMNGLNPGQMVIKIVNDELVNLMGSETTEIALRPASEVTVIMMAGLQGAGKTTTTAKLAGKFKSKGRKPLLVACDVYRPAAITQLQINGEKQGVEVFSMGDKQNPVNIAKAAVEHAKSHGFNVVILDTAGRLQNDLTQMTYGFSRDDAGKFLDAYYDAKIFENDPFAKLDQVGVGKLMKMAIELGKPVNPKLHVGICGEHGGDPSSVEFCNSIGLDYVSCSPFRVPIARLAAAQAAIAEKNAK